MVVGAVVFSLLLASLVDASVNPKICPICRPVSSPKPFPTIPDSFKAVFSWNMKSVSTTYFVEEVFSEELGVGVMLVDGMLNPGITTKFITRADTDEFFVITDYDHGYGSQCSVESLKSNDFAFPFKNVKGQEHLLSGKDVLFMGASSAIMEYRGNDTIDDIDVDVWSGCLYLTDSDLTYNATYYFTLNTTTGGTWNTASGMQSVLKRIHLIGNNFDNTNPVETVYEFAYFDNVIPMDTSKDLEIYEPPLGAYCEGRKFLQKMPEVPDYFSFYMEVFDPQRDLATYTDEYYDFSNNLTRMDHEGIFNRSYSSRPIKLIHDYQTGLAYTIDKYTGHCNISQIKTDKFDNEIVPGAKSKVRMRNPKEFFDLEDSKEYPWIFEGTHVVRGVPCLVWISLRPYPTKDSSERAYWEWYFTSTNWVESNGDIVENLEPFKLVVTVPKLDNQQTHFNIYKFNQEPPDERYFEVSECFEQHNESRSYEFIMRADVRKFNLDNHVGTLRYYVAASIEAFGNIRSTRVHRLQFIFDVKYVFVTFTLVDHANIQGSILHPINQSSLDEAEMYLKKAIEAEDFLVYYITNEGTATQFQVYKESFTRVEHNSKPGQSFYYIIDDKGADDTAAKPQVKPADVSNGAAAGLAIVLLILGVVLLSVPYYFLVIRKRNNMDDFRSGQLTMDTVQE